VILRIEAPLFAFEVGRLGPRRQRQKPEKELGIAGFFAGLQEGLGVSGVFNVVAPIVASGVTGNARGPVVEAEPSGLGVARERLASLVGGHGVAVRGQGNATLPRGADLRAGGHIKGRPRQRPQ